MLACCQRKTESRHSKIFSLFMNVKCSFRPIHLGLGKGARWCNVPTYLPIPTLNVCNRSHRHIQILSFHSMTLKPFTGINIAKLYLAKTGSIVYYGQMLCHCFRCLIRSHNIFAPVQIHQNGENLFVQTQSIVT